MFADALRPKPSKPNVAYAWMGRVSVGILAALLVRGSVQERPQGDTLISTHLMAFCSRGSRRESRNSLID